MQIIEIIAAVAAIVVCVLMIIVALAFLAFGIAADIMERQDSWTDNGDREAGKSNDREA